VLRQSLEPEQYLSIRYTDRLAEAGAVASVGSRGDSYDNAAAESTIGLYKAELVRPRGPWKGIDDLEIATLEHIDWFNTGASTAPAATSHPRSSKPRTTIASGSSACPFPTNPASIKPRCGSYFREADR
jgi:hypothetical protein